MANQVCILTPPGAGAIAVIRLTGEDVLSFAKAHLSRLPRVGACIHADLMDAAGAVIDDPVAVSVDDQTLDLSLHGGPWVIQRTMDLLRDAGFEHVGAIAGRETTILSEVLQSLPHVATKEAIAILLAQPASWERMLKANDHQAMRRAAEDRAIPYLLSPPTVAIVGVPNVGKSTLANHLFARDHSITADLPGTTRDWVGERANLGGLVVTLIDTPGIRETTDTIEREAIGRAKTVIKRADGIVNVLDVTQPLDVQWVVGSAMRTLHQLERAEAIIVLNKVDQPPVWNAAGFPEAIRLCAKTGTGIDTLRTAIRAQFGCADLDPTIARAWTDRQRKLLCM